METFTVEDGVWEGKLGSPGEKPAHHMMPRVVLRGAQIINEVADFHGVQVAKLQVTLPNLK